MRQWAVKARTLLKQLDPLLQRGKIAQHQRELFRRLADS
jgi:hypothetical protein